MDNLIYRPCRPESPGARVWIRPGEHRNVGAALAELRKCRELTQDELAARPGKPQSFVSSYENCQRRLDVLELLVIVAALGGDPEVVLRRIRAAIGSTKLI